MTKKNKLSHFKSVLIITYGRSGSTLLQGILNSISGYVIKGENENFIFDFYQAYKKIKYSNFNDIYGNTVTSSQHPWYGFENIDLNIFCNDLGNLIKKQLLIKNNNSDYLVYGFKEIRYLYIKPSELEEYLDFLKLVFPSSAFIFNFRNHDDLLKSDWWQGYDANTWKQKIVDFETACFDYYNKHQNNCFINHYDKMIDLSSDNLRQLFDFLQEPYEEAKLARILSLKHSDGNKKNLSSFKEIIYKIDLDRLNQFDILHYSVDRYENDNSILIGGLFLLDKHHQVSEIFLVDNDGNKEIGTYGLPSPMFGKNNLDKPNSDYCRYIVSMKTNAYPIKLMAQTKQGNAIHFITVHEKNNTITNYDSCQILNI